MTADGKIATRAGSASGFTSGRDHARLLEIRAMGDAILAGRRTVEVDQMTMTIPGPLQDIRSAAGKNQSPLRVLISNSGEFSPDLPVFQVPGRQPLIYLPETRQAPLPTGLETGAELHILPGTRLDMAAVLQDLRHRHDVRTIICEGGPTLLRTLLDSDLVDEMFITIAPCLFGGMDAPTLTGWPGDFLSASREFRLDTFHVADSECFTHYVRHRPRKRFLAGAQLISSIYHPCIPATPS